MHRNIRLFIAFRLLFNARFYYPIFAVLQLDYGLSMSQFAVLNGVWAVSIVLLEVPSGAMADRIGRKRMVVIASVLMFVEMAVIAFVPLGNSSLVFWAWVLNRFLSGAAEASASGADEALAYDSLPEDDRKSRWPKVLARLTVLTSTGMAVAMLVGAAVYDPDLVNRVLGWFGRDVAIDKETVMRFPVYLTLALASGAIGVSLAMKEPPQETECGGETSVWSNIFAAGKWILETPLVFALILAALVHDSVVRLFLTMNSEYFRLIEIPDAAFGVLGAVFAGLGVFTPKIAEKLVKNDHRGLNYGIVSVATFLGLAGSALAWPYYGVAVLLPFAFAMGFLNFFTSHYLNAEVDSKHRATVLSFKGLALNLGFGGVSLVYAGILKTIRATAELPEESKSSDPAFPASLPWLPPLFLIMLVPVAAYYFLRVRPGKGES